MFNLYRLTGMSGVAGSVGMFPRLPAAAAAPPRGRGTAKVPEGRRLRVERYWRG